MSLKDIQRAFLSGKCEDLGDHLDIEKCKNLYSQYQAKLRSAGCKCKHGGIRKSFLLKLEELLTQQ